MLNPVSGERAGIGHYTFHLVRALLELDRQNEYVLYFDHRMPGAITDDFMHPNVTVRRLPFSRYRKFLPFAYTHLLLAAYLTRDRLDVFHAPANVMPLSYNRPTVVTVHDLAIYEHPEWFPSQIAATRLLVPQTIKRANAIIAVSKATKRDLLKHFTVPAGKVIVVPEAVDTTLLPLRDMNTDIHRAYKLPPQYVLYIGTIEPRKNLSTLIQAWRQLNLKYPAVTKDKALIIAGGLGYHGKRKLKLIQAQPKSTVKYLGYVSHNHKIKLIRSAAAFVFPSRYEGFGLPVLEAMQLGTPVITTNVSAIPEVAGSAALLFKPDDVRSLTENIRQILIRPALAHRLSAAGRKQAKQYSWSRTARETLAVYRRVAGHRRAC